MGGEQAANVLAQITREQRAREGKEVKLEIKKCQNASESGSYAVLCWSRKKCIILIKFLMLILD